ncbi:MAG: hypothetical protein R6U98_19680 [Pirellulaceae bacterium]
MATKKLTFRFKRNDTVGKGGSRPCDSHDLTDRQRNILQILADGERRRFGFVYDALDHPPAERTVRDDLILLRDLGLVESAGRGGERDGGG